MDQSRPNVSWTSTNACVTRSTVCSEIDRKLIEKTQMINDVINELAKVDSEVSNLETYLPATSFQDKVAAELDALKKSVNMIEISQAQLEQTTTTTAGLVLQTQAGIADANAALRQELQGEIGKSIGQYVANQSGQSEQMEVAIIRRKMFLAPIRLTYLTHGSHTAREAIAVEHLPEVSAAAVAVEAVSRFRAPILSRTAIAMAAGSCMTKRST